MDDADEQHLKELLNTALTELTSAASRISNDWDKDDVLRQLVRSREALQTALDRMDS
jgi:hypothetical protein